MNFKNWKYTYTRFSFNSIVSKFWKGKKKNSQTAICIDRQYRREIRFSAKYGVKQSLFIIYYKRFSSSGKICARRYSIESRDRLEVVVENYENARNFHVYSTSISAFVVTLMQTFPRVHSRLRVTRCSWSFNPFQRAVLSLFLSLCDPNSRGYFLDYGHECYKLI